jgi:hypothetical protein
MGCWHSRDSDFKNFKNYVYAFNLSEHEELKKDLDNFEKYYKDWIVCFDAKWKDKSENTEKKIYHRVNLMSVADNMQEILTKLKSSTYSNSKLQAKDRQDIVDQACRIWQNALDEDKEKQETLEKEVKTY